MTKLAYVFIIITSVISYCISLYLGYTHQIPVWAMFGYAMLNILLGVYAGLELTKPISVDPDISSIHTR